MELDRSVSVVLATYNGERFLRQQLESLLSQTLRPTELIVADDQSTDNTLSILSTFASSSPFPVSVYVNESRLHFGENFLRAASRSRARYLAFCDQDDVWLPRKLERSICALEDADCDLVSHDAVLITADGKHIGRMAHRDRGGVYGPLTLPPWNVFFGFTMTIRRELFGLLPYADRGIDLVDPSRKLSHDRWIYFLATTLGSTVYLREPLALYRQHNGNAFGSQKRSIGKKLSDLVKVDFDDLSRRLEISRIRSVLLTTASGNSWSTASMHAGAEYWRKLADVYQDRVSVAQSRKLLVRCAIVYRLWAKGAYAPLAAGGLTFRALFKDAAAALLYLKR